MGSMREWYILCGLLVLAIGFWLYDLVAGNGESPLESIILAMALAGLFYWLGRGVQTRKPRK